MNEGSFDGSSVGSYKKEYICILDITNHYFKISITCVLQQQLKMRWMHVPRDLNV